MVVVVVVVVVAACTETCVLRCRWTSVCIHLLLWKRRRLLRHGRILLSRSRQKLLRKEEVDAWNTSYEDES